MAYEPKYMKDYDEIKKSFNDQEDRISGFSKRTLQTVLNGRKIEWGIIKGEPNTSGYMATNTEGYMNDPSTAVLLSNTKGYSNRKYIVNGYTVSDKNRLLQFYVHDESGRPVTENVTIQYIVVYE